MFADRLLRISTPLQVPARDFGQMAGFVSSEAVFEQRCREIGFSAAQTTQLKAAGYRTLSNFAYSCAYVPGNPDEAPLKEAVVKITGDADPDMHLYRRLFFESFTLTQSDLKTLVERSDDAPARRLAVAERSARYKAQQQRLCGLTLRGELECSDSLVDDAVDIYDQNRLRYIPWAKCTRKADEIQGVKKVKVLLELADGSAKTGSRDESPVADTGDEYLLRNALARRGLAMDQAGLLEFKLHEAWAEKLFTARMRPALKGHARVTFGQMEEADRALFLRMAELTRDGVVPDSAGKRPLDDAIKLASVEPEVVQLLAQLQSGKRAWDETPHDRSGHKRQNQDKHEKTSREGKTGKGTSKGGKSGRTGKGARTGKGPNLPEGLVGSNKTPDGSHICFAYNLGTCPDRDRPGCSKGKHLCTLCFQSHPYCGNH